MAQTASRPGALDTGTVNLSTGSVSFPITLASLPGRNGLDFNLSIQYSSMGTREIVDTWTVEAPTGVMGLGWSFPQERIVRIWNGTTQESTYGLCTENTLYALVKGGADAAGEIYESTSYQFWKVRYQPERELWTITKEDGTDYFYGGNVQQAEGQTNTSMGNSVEWGVRWGTWTGPSNVVEKQEQFPVAWNLTSIENIWGDRVTLLYEQDQQLVGTAGATRKEYTQACRLSQVIGATGESILLHYGPEEEAENPYETRVKRHTLPGGGPDAYQDRLERHFLDSLEVLNANGGMVSHVQLRYASIGSGEMQKQILKSMTCSNSQGHPCEPPRLFAYYGETSADGVSVSKTDASKVAHGGALFGALKSMTAPQGATTSYQYTELAIPNARRDLDIPRPGNEWHHPLTYLGLDYAVVIWRGTGTRERQIHVSAYQWVGRWVATTLDELTVGDAADAKNFQVEIAPTFFAIITPGQAQTVHLFRKRPYSYGGWRSYSLKVGTLTDCLIASGDDFFAILDRSDGKLYCFTYNMHNNVNNWQSSPVFDAPLKTGTHTVFGLTAGNNYICTLSAVPDNAFHPELRLYSLDALGVWHAPIPYKSEPFFPGGSFGTTLDKLSFMGSTTFVSLLVSGIVSSPGNLIDRRYRLFVYRWTETTIGSEELTIGAMPAPTHSDETQLTVVGNMMIVGPMTDEKVVYQYNGERWLSKVFKNDSAHNNYLGDGSFSTTKNGQAQYWEFNPNTSQWDTGKIPAYKDGNPTLWEKFWSNVWPFLSLSIGILTLPLSFGTGLLVDLALLPFDLYSLLLPPGTGGGGHDSGRFFTGDNHVYYQDAPGTWRQIGELLSEAEKAEKPVPGEGTTFETQDIQFQNTQAASTFIAYAITQDRKKILKGGSSVRPSGYPKYISKIQLLKNGAFLSSATTLPEQEALQRSPDDETNLVGWNAFLTFQGGETLREATSLKLHRVIQDGFQGPLRDDVVSRVSVHDGYEDTHIHYNYETASAECLPIGTTALYNKVTTIYSGTSTTATRSNGHTESYFYVGDITSLPNQPADQTSTNNANYPALVAGRLYATRAFDGAGNQVAATTHSWLAYIRSLLGRGTGRFLRQVKEERESDGSTKVVENDYAVREYDGFPGRTIVSNYDVTGQEEAISTRYSYGCDLYPQLKERHILAPVAQASTHVNGITTAFQATTWLPTPGLPFRLTPGQDLPPQFQGTGWSVTGRNSVSTTGNSVLFPSSEQQTLTVELPPLTLIPNSSGKLLFTYDCTFMIFAGSTRAKLAVLVDNAKIWDDEITVSEFSKTFTIDLPRRHQRVEWRVEECSVEVPPHATHHRSPLVEVSVHHIQMPDLQYLAPAATYRAKKPTEFQARPEDAPLDWLKTSEVVARNPIYGIITETRDVDAITSSTIYDTNYQFPVAHFVHASVENHEAGYYGFEDYENKEGWQLTGTPDGDLSSHSGQKAFSGENMRIEPLAFTPRSATIPYIVSAWVKTRSGGSGGQIGFGSILKPIAPDNDDWQYVEFVTGTPLADQKPFASCDGAIDDFRFGPVDAPFSATVYDPTYHHVTEQLGTNGETVRLLYDDLQTLIAMTGPDGKEISRLMTETHSRDGEKPFNSAKPNMKLSLLPRNGGHYYRTLADYRGYKELHRRYAADPQVFVEQRVTPATANYGFKLRVSASKNTLNPTFFGFQFGDRVVLSDAPHRIIFHQTMPMYASYNRPIKSFTPEHDPLDGSEWLLIVLEKRAFFFLDGQFLFSETFTEQFVRLSAFWGPEESRISCSDVFLFSDPIVELNYTDGLDRVIQTVHLDQHAEGTVASQVLYDGWGHPAVTTKPLHIPEISLTYQQELVKTFDWNSGKMTGKVVDYYREAILDYYREGHGFVIDQKLDDGQYPYSRQIAEANPLARISQVTQPGVDFQAGSPLAVRIDYRRTPEADALLADLGLTGKAGHYTSITTYHPFEKNARAVTTRLFDLQGTLIALRRGQGTTAQTSIRSVTYASDGTSSATSTQPNAFPHQKEQANQQYRTTITRNFLGHAQVSTDNDRNTEQCIYDQAGRICFKLDAEGAAQNPHRILYWHYDSLGRILEEGIVRQEWNREQLQHYADVSSPGEAPGSGMGVTWTRRYVYDTSANTTTTNLKGRLCEVRTRGEDTKEVRESFEYDLAGKMVSTQLIVEAFDTQTRVTRYEYDRHGNVTRIIYPYDLSGTPGFEVHYFYNTNGQLASIGTAGDPSRYATYDYDLEGRIKTEHLNNRRLQRNHSYSIQGRLLSLQDRQGIFSEELSYRDASGNFKDGSVVGATITGFATPVHSWYAYSYQYDEYSRLAAAQTETAGYGIVSHPAWDIQGPDGHIEYDANGNLLHIKQGQTSSMYRYKPGTNQLAFLLRNSASRQPFGFEADELDHFHTRPTVPMHPGDWYCEPANAEPITMAEKHSGTQSHQLGVRLFSPIAVTPGVSAYSFTGWIKNDEENLEVEVTIQHDPIGPILARQTIRNTNGQWEKFECMIEDAGHTKWLFACISPKSPEIIPAVYIDDVSFGPLEQETYQHNQNGWMTKTGKLDALQHDPHTALPVDIRSRNQRTYFRYGGRGQRVLKTAIIRREIESHQRLYIHGGNAYPLTEITQDIDITDEQPPRRGTEILYVYGPGGIVAMCENGQTTSFLLKDHLGSLRVVLDEENQPIATFHYLPFGSLLPDNGNSPEAIKRFRYLYTGQEYDEETGLYNYRARLYDSDLGRFLTPDPKREFPSPYVYVNNNPLNFTDPTGEMLLRLQRAARFNGGRALHFKIVSGRRLIEFESKAEAESFLQGQRYISKETSWIRSEYRNAPRVSAAEVEGLEGAVPLTEERFNQDKALFKRHSDPVGIGTGERYPGTDHTLYSATTEKPTKLIGTFTWGRAEGGIEIIAHNVSGQFFNSLPKNGLKEVQILDSYYDSIIGYIPFHVLKE